MISEQICNPTSHISREFLVALEAFCRTTSEVPGKLWNDIAGAQQEGDSCISFSGGQEIQIPCQVPKKRHFAVPHCTLHSKAEALTSCCEMINPSPKVKNLSRDQFKEILNQPGRR